MKTQNTHSKVKNLAPQQLRVRAIRAFLGAIALGVSLAVVSLFFSVQPVYIYVMGAFSIGTFIVVGRSYWKQAQKNRATRGARKKKSWATTEVNPER